MRALSGYEIVAAFGDQFSDGLGGYPVDAPPRADSR
jgi:hypothetical protein